MRASASWATLAVACLAPGAACAETIRASDAASLAAAAARARPGDTVIMTRGIWRDQRLTIDTRGTAEAPVVVRAETPGGVILSGASDLRIAGAHVVVSGLVFRDGAAPGAAVIATDAASRDVRLTEIVIDDFNPADRRRESVWVALAGGGHRVDHGWFARKRNRGATLLAAGDAPHRIERNVFGPRPPLGAAGGETIRVTARGTVAERNLFDRCDGAAAIVAVEASEVAIRDNTVLRSRGGIVVRGGTASRIERNLIRAGAAPMSGGIHVAAGGQIVRGNYIDRVAGRDALSAIVVDAAAPPTLVEHNSIIDSARITLAGGAVRFDDNLIRSTLDPMHTTGRIDAAGNLSSHAPSLQGIRRDSRDFAATRTGIAYLEGTDVGAPRDLSAVTRSEAGPAWYREPPAVPTFPDGGDVIVAPGDLASAVAAAPAGATLRLSAGTYRLARGAIVARPITIHGPADARIVFSGATAFQLADRGSLRIEGVTISGRDAPRRAGNAVIRASATPTIANYSVMLDHVTIRDLVRAPRFDVVATTPGTLADRIDIRGADIGGVSGAIVAARGANGWYAADRVRIVGSTVSNVGRIADVTRSPGDDPIGPVVEIARNHVGRGGDPIIRIENAQVVTIADNAFTGAGVVAVSNAAGRPMISIRCNAPAPHVTRQGSVEPAETAAIRCASPLTPPAM